VRLDAEPDDQVERVRLGADREELVIGPADLAAAAVARSSWGVAATVGDGAGVASGDAQPATTIRMPSRTVVARAALMIG